MHIFAKLAVFLVGFVAFFALLGWYLSPQDELQTADAIVAISGDEGARLKTAIELYREGWAPLLIFSGAARDPMSPSNAATMRTAAVQQGVEPSRILTEEKSRNTQENALFSSELIQERQLKRIILVTSPYHQRRASIEFSQALGPNVEVINYSAHGGGWRSSTWWLTPGGWYVTLSEAPKTIFALFN